MSDLIEKSVLKKRKKQRDKQLKCDLRDKIDFGMTLSQINVIEDNLIDLAKTGPEVDISNGKVSAYKAVLDSKWKKLNKLLPDLKAIEMTVDDISDFKPKSDEELLEIIEKSESD